MGGDVILGPMSEERYISQCWQARRDPFWSPPAVKRPRSGRFTAKTACAARGFCLVQTLLYTIFIKWPKSPFWGVKKSMFPFIL